MSTTVYFTEGDEVPRFCSSYPAAVLQTSKASRCQLEYLNEGGANFVFRILPVDQEEQISVKLQGKLLRLRKDLPHVPSAEDQLQGLETNFQPLFPTENLVQHELVSLDPDVTVMLNSSLQRMVRPTHRSSDFLRSQEASGLLVTDMTPGTGEILLQLKPKWLTQSPNAPSDSKRCRTCAVRAHRASERIRTATDAQETCPLDLVNGNFEERTKAVQSITTDTKLQIYLLDQALPLLHQLRTNQAILDKDGALKTPDVANIHNLCKAMTLRDCTMFLKRSENYIEARLGDLDLKQPEKLQRWKKIEKNLINDGWYTNTEHADFRKAEVICLLSRPG